ncbi:MAG: metallophosphoesterase family protein [Clostridia bacterium]|nr:metallophosphoesterase family protein [Clostridia bacterium]
MKILAVADEESPALWDYYVPGRLAEYDLILSCGDLKAAYLTFLVTMSRARLLYVHGNHDGSYSSAPPEGCENIDGQLVSYNGVRILGLGGCLWYHPGPHQYTEKQMRRRVAKLRRAIKKAGGVDIVIAHAPPKGLGDMEDPAHRGFEVFRELIDEYLPRFFLHGHTHLRYGAHIAREQINGGTRIINVSERFELEIPEGDHPAKQKEDLVFITRRPRESDSIEPI